MKNKKGFTLVEIIAVIALIGVVLLLVIPNVVRLFNNAQKSIFYDEVLSVYKNATTTYIYRSSTGDYTKRFCVGMDSTTNALDLEEKDDFYYDITVNSYGEVTSLKVSNLSYGITLTNSNGVKKKTITQNAITEGYELYCDANNAVSLNCVITNTKRQCNIFNYDYDLPNETA